MLIWLPLTWAGLALFLAVRPSGSTGSETPSRALWFVIAGVAVVVVGRLLAQRSTVDRIRGLLLGSASGVLFGLVAGLAKLVLTQLGGGLVAIVTDWPVYVLAVTGIWAVLLNQRAYQVSRLSVSAPVLNIAQVVVAVGFGIVVFGEEFGSSPAVLIGEVVGLAVVVAGIYRLASRPDGEDEVQPDGATEPDRSTAA